MIFFKDFPNISTNVVKERIAFITKITLTDPRAKQGTFIAAA